MHHTKNSCPIYLLQQTSLLFFILVNAILDCVFWTKGKTVLHFIWYGFHFVFYLS